MQSALVSKLTRRFLMILLALGLAGTAWGQTTWTAGDGTFAWNNAGNWSSGVPIPGTPAIVNNNVVFTDPPAAFDDLTIGGGLNVTFNAGFNVIANVTVNGSLIVPAGQSFDTGTGTCGGLGQIQLGSGANLVTTGSIGSLQVSSGTATVNGVGGFDAGIISGNLSIAGAVTARGSPGAVTVNPAATLTLSGPLICSGQLTINNGANFGMAGNSVQANGASYGGTSNIITGGTLTLTGGTLNLQKQHPGNLVISGATSFTGAAITHVLGTTTINAGFTLNNNFRSGGAITLDAPVTGGVGIGFRSDAAMTINAGGIVTIGGILRTGSTLTLNGNGTVNSTGTITVGTTATFNGSGGVTTVGTMTLTAGNLTWDLASTSTLNAANLTISAGDYVRAAAANGNVLISGNMSVSGNSTQYGTLQVNGTLDFSGIYTQSSGTLSCGASLATFSGIVTHSGGTINVGAGGVLFSSDYAGSGGANLVGHATGGIDFRGGITFAAYTDAAGVVSISQGNAQVFNPNGKTITNLQITKSGGTVNINNNLTVVNLSKSGAGTATFSAGTLTLNSILTVTGGTLNINTTYTGPGDFTASSGTVNIGASYGSTGNFTVSGATVNVGTAAFSCGVMSVSSGSFTQTGVNGFAQTVGSISVTGTGSCVWDSGAAGGTLTVNGNIANSVTLSFNNKAVTLGAASAFSGTISLYDLTVGVAAPLSASAPCTLTVRRNLTLSSTYTNTNFTLTLGGASGAAGNLTDNNATKQDLGAVTISTATKTQTTALAFSSITINSQLATGDNPLNVTGSITGAGTLNATGSTQTIAVGGSVSVATVTAGGALIRITGSLSSGTFTANTSTVEFTGAGASTINTYTLNNLTVAKTVGNSLSASGDLTINGSLTLTSGTFVTGAFTHQVANNWNSSAITLTATGSTIQLTSTNPNITMGAGQSFNHLTLSQGGNLLSDITVAGNLVVASPGPGTLSMNTRTINLAGNLTMTAGQASLSAGNSTLNLNGSGNQTIGTNAVSWYNLTIGNHNAGSTVTFNQALNVSNILTVTGSNAYNITINNGGTAGNAVTFNNAGNLTIAAGYTFDGGVTATAPGSLDIGGTIATSNDPLSMGTQANVISLTNTTAFNTAGGALNIGTISGNQILSCNAGTGALTASGQLGSGTALASFTLNNASTADFQRGINASGAISLTSTGLLTLGDPSGSADFSTADVVTTAGTFSQSGASSVSLSGDLSIVGTISFASAITLGGAVQISSSGTATLSGAISNATAQDLHFAGTGAVNCNGSLGAATDLGTITISGSTGLVSFASTVDAAAITQNNGANPVLFQDNVTLTGNAAFDANLTLDGLVFQSTGGTIRFGTAAGSDTLLVSGAATTVQASNQAITFNAVTTLGANLTVSSGAAALALNNTIDDDAAGGFRQWTLNLNNNGTTTGTALTIAANLGASGELAAINTDDGAAAGDLTRIDASAAAITLQADRMTFSDDVVLVSGGANTVSIVDTVNSGTDIQFVRSLVGNRDLILNTQGGLLFSGAVGGSGVATDRLGDGTGASLTVNSAGPTTFNATLQTQQGISQANASGLLSFMDNVTIAGGATASSFLSPVFLSGLSFTSAGALSFGSADAAGDATNVTNDELIIGGAAVTITTAAANANQTFNGEICDNGSNYGADGQQSLTISSGNGVVTINGVVGDNLGAGGFAQLQDLTVNSTLTGSAGIIFGNDSIDDLGIAGDLILNAPLIDLRGRTVTANTIALTAGTRLLADLHASSSWDTTGGSAVSLTTPWFFIDCQSGAGVVLSLADGLSLSGNLVLYRGGLSTAGKNLSAGGDLALFGPTFSFDDTDRSAGTTEYRYVDYAAMVAVRAFPGSPNGNFNAGAGLVGSTVQVGANFYANGVSMNPGAAWTLRIQDNDSVVGLLANNGMGNGASGGRYAVAYNTTVNNCNVRDSAGTATDNCWLQAVENCSVSGGGYVATAANRPGLSAAPRTVYDNLVELRFNRALENSLHELGSFVNQVATNDGLSYDNGTAKINSVSIWDDRPGSWPASGNLSAGNGNGILEPNENGQLIDVTAAPNDAVLTTIYGTGGIDIPLGRPLYFQASGTWNTDADGGSAGAAGSTNRAGVHQTSVPNLSWMKNRLYAALGKASVANAGFDTAGTPSATGRITSTTDACRPVLISVWTGRSNYSTGTGISYNGHNFLHLRYSEPIDLSSLQGVTAAGGLTSAGTANPGSINYRSSGSGATGMGSLGGTGTVSVSGLGLSYTGNLTLGARSENTANAHNNPDYVNHIFRSTASTTENPSGAQGLTIFVAGYAFLNGSLYWPGYLDASAGANSDPTGQAFVQAIEPDVKDAVGNAIEPSANPRAGKVGGLLGVSASVVAANVQPSGVAAAGYALSENYGGFSTGWDVDPPQFAKVSPISPKSEIITQLDLTGTTISSFEMHILDQGSLNAVGAPDWNIKAPSTTAPFSHNTSANPNTGVLPDGYLNPSQHPVPGSTIISGIRDSSWAYRGDAEASPYNIVEKSAFSFEAIGVPATTNFFTSGIGSMVDNRQFSTVTQGQIGNADDPFLNVSITPNPNWGPLTNMRMDYSSALGGITDHAGNLMLSVTGVEAIERTPPSMELALAIAGKRNMYVQFSEPVYRGYVDTVYHSAGSVAMSDFYFVASSGAAPNITGLRVLERDPRDATNIVKMMLTVDRDLSADDAFRLRLMPRADPAYPATHTNKTFVFDDSENNMQLASRPLTDIGLGVGTPVFAIDDIVNPAVAASTKPVTVFDGSKYLPGKGTIVIQAKNQTTAAATQGLPMFLYYDVAVEANKLYEERFWFPTNIPGLTILNANGQPESISPNTAARALNGSLEGGGLATFRFNTKDPELVNNAALEFVMQLGSLPLANYLDSNDPRSIVPWKFMIGGVLEQRGKVTILNNVIDAGAAGKTVLTYELARPGLVTVTVFALDGTLVKILQRGQQAKGSYMLTWDGTNVAGKAVARGMYVIRAVGPDFDESRKVMVVK